MDPQDLEALLAERRHFADKVISEYGTLRESYQDWQDRIERLDNVYKGDWHVVWPDSKLERSLPKVPNYPRLSRKHRTQLTAETMPNIVVRPEKMDAKNQAEKKERIITGWWNQSHVPLQIPGWAGDLIDSGLSVVKVMPDFSQPLEKRFPKYARLDPRMCFPSPMFTPGPFVDDMLVTYEETVRTVERRFGCDLSGLVRSAMKASARAEHTKVRVIEYYDDNRAMVVCEAMYKTDSGMKRKPFEVIMDERHKLGKTPVAIGVTPSHDGIYRSPFDDGLAVLNVANRLMTLHMDAAALKVYSELVVDGEIEGDIDRGPGAIIQSKSRDTNVMGHIGYLTHPASGYDNYQVMRTIDTALQKAFLIPPSLLGNPDESIVSASGISATQTMPNAEVASLQRDSLAPMLQAANELAMRADERWGEAKKTITGVQRGASFAETYTPSKDIAGDYSNEVKYGLGSGLDKVNTGVMVKQDLGAGLISRQEARELSPFVPDPIRTEKMVRAEQFEDAGFASILAATQLPPGTPGALDISALVAVVKDVRTEGKDLFDALEAHVERMQMVAPPASPSAGPELSTPGLAGAAEPQQPAISTPLEDLLVQ